MSRTTIRATAAAATLLAVALAAPAPAATKHRRPTTFEGSCKLTGDVAFHTPIGNTPRATAFTDTARGTCTGKLNGRAVHEVPVVNRVGGSGTLSCLAGTAHTADTLVFTRRFRLRITTDSVFAATQAVAHSSGAVSGHSVEHVAFQADQATLSACQAGALRSAHYDLDARMLTPLVG